MAINSRDYFTSFQPADSATDFTADIGRTSDDGSGTDTYTRKSVPPVPLNEKWLLTINEAAAYCIKHY